MQDLQHLAAQLARTRAALRDQPQQLEQAVGRDLVVEAGLEGRLVLHPAQHLMPSIPSSASAAWMVGHAHHVHQQVGGEVAGGGDHLVGQLASRSWCGPGAGTARGRRPRLTSSMNGLPVHDAHELVAHVDGRVQASARRGSTSRYTRQEHGQLHGGGGVEPGVGVVRPLQRGLRVVERDAQALQAVALLDARARSRRASSRPGPRRPRALAGRSFRLSLNEVAGPRVGS